MKYLKKRKYIDMRSPRDKRAKRQRGFSVKEIDEDCIKFGEGNIRIRRYIATRAVKEMIEYANSQGFKGKKMKKIDIMFNWLPLSGYYLKFTS